MWRRMRGCFTAIGVLAAVASVGAQDLKFASLRWRQESVIPPTVRFQLTTAWRWSAFMDDKTGCQAQCKNVGGGLSCGKTCTGSGASGQMAPAVGDTVSLYDIYSSTHGPMNKGVPLLFDFGDASQSLTGERIAVQSGTEERPIAKCRFINAAEFDLCLEGYVQDINRDTDTMLIQTDIVRRYPNLGIFVASFQGCCRPGTLVNNPNSPWKLSATIVFSSELPNESPIIALPPHVIAIQGKELSFKLAAFQAEGHTLSYRVGTAEEHNPVDIVGE